MASDNAQPPQLSVALSVGGSTRHPAQVLAVSPARNAGFRENSVAHFSLSDSAPWRLFIDDEPMDATPNEPSNGWTWTPKFFAGPVTAELVSESTGAVHLYVLEVEPDPKKVDAEHFEHMVRRIREADPELILGDEPALTAVGHEGLTSNPWVFFARLRRLGDTFLKSLRSISRQPIRVITRTRMDVPLQLVRRLDARSVVGATRHPSLLRALIDSDGLAPGSVAGTTDVLDVPHVEATLDGAANRCIAAVSRSVRLHAQRLREELDRNVRQERSGDAVTALAPRWERRRAFLDSFEHDLSRALRTTPWLAVTRTEITAAGLNAVSSDPTYERTFRTGWRILRGGLAGDEHDDHTWMSPSWQIFERWCFVELADDLRQAFPDLAWSRPRRHLTRPLAAWVGQGEDRTIELLLQPRFRGSRPGRSGRYASISTRRVPDVVLIQRTARRSQFFVLDAKYMSVRRSILEAMESAHVYHDALRYDGRPPDLALLLVPSATRAAWLEAPGYHLANGVGIWQTGTWRRGALVGRLLAK